MLPVVIVAVAATLGNLLVGWDSSTIAGMFFFLIWFFIIICCFKWFCRYPCCVCVCLSENLELMHVLLCDNRFRIIVVFGFWWYSDLRT